MVDAELMKVGRLVGQAAHNGVQRKYTGKPYFSHCENVRDFWTQDYLMSGYPHELLSYEEGVVVCYLHDVLEDTAITESDLLEVFSGNIVNVVQALTNPSSKLTKEQFSQTTRLERKLMDFEHVAKQHHTIQRIKLCDRTDNLTDLLGTIKLVEPQYIKKYVMESAMLLEHIGRSSERLSDRLMELIKQINGVNLSRL